MNKKSFDICDKDIHIDKMYQDMFLSYDDIMTPSEIAEALNVPIKRIHKLLRSGEILSIRYERFYRVAKVWLIDYIQKYGLIREKTFYEQRKSKVLLFCRTPKSRKEIQEFLDLSDKKYFRENVINPMVESGELTMTLPEKPTSVKQKYISTFMLNE